ncbi:MAG: CoA transferase [Alphaproteobacteria bacterium]|nr:CoA transferase [Alphaproteobacteria bacterium]
MTGPSRSPLRGVTVIDLGQIYNGPYAGFLLAMAGADVIKVEPLEGEPLRKRGGQNLSLALAMLNSNKRDIAINLKHPEGKALLIELTKGADILLENYAPGVLDRLGVGAAVLQAANPRLIYASGTGYGLSGPDRDNLAMDLTVQAVGGIMSINGPPDGPPMKAGLALCDFLGGVHLYAAIATALYERSVTGTGRVVEVAMQEAVYPALATNLTSLHNNGGRQPPRTGNNHPAGTSAPYNVYPAKDGHIAIICVREEHWHNLLRAIGQEESKDDPRFADQWTRAKNREAVDALVAGWTVHLPKQEAFARLQAQHVPAAPVRDLVEVTNDAHMHARGMLNWVDHPALGRVVLPHSPLRFHGETRPALNPSPELGAHTRAILMEKLGLDASAIDNLVRAGVVGEGG